MQHVFISYMHENRDVVDRLCYELTSRGIKVWLDRNDIKPGVPWKDAIRDAIRDGAFFIACFSKEYNQRNKTYMNEELTIAIEELRQRSTDRVWFIPVKLNRCKIPDRNIGGGETFNDRQHVKLYKDWDDGIQRIIKLMRSEFHEPIVNGDIPETIEPLKLFIAYAHEDTEAMNELIKRLTVLKSGGVIDIWHDNEILPGDKWREEIFSTHLPNSDLLLYLVSAHSLASKNCNEELAAALNAKMRVIPIILEDCDWLNYQLSNFQALPDKGNPINKWQPESEGWQNVVNGIRKTVNKMQSQTNPSSGVSEEELRAELAFQRGNTLSMLGQQSMAVEAYSAAIELNPHHAHAHNNRGLSLHIKGEHNSAIKDYTKAIELNPNYAGGYNNRGVTYGEINEYDRAIRDYQVAIKLAPGLILAYNNLGIAYFERGSFDKAIENYNRAIEMDPELAEVYHNRGNSYLSKGEVERAIKDYNKAIELKPDYPVAYNSLGEAYRLTGKIECAIRNYSTAIILNSDYVAAYVNRGLAYRSKGAVDSAIKDYNRAIELKPDCSNAYNDRGAVYADKGEFDLAIADFNKAMENTSNIAGLHYNRGIVYSVKGKFDLAIADFNKAIENIPDIAAPYYNHKAEGIIPDITFIYYHRGVAWLHLQKWKRAGTDLTTAKNMGYDIIASFHNDYESIEYFEQRTDIQLPENIAALLTQPTDKENE